MIPAILTVDGVSKSYGGKPAVSTASLRLEPGKVTALLGPSGCGKSTLLRLIAGLDVADAGVISLGGRILAGPGVFTPPEARGVGLVFQDFALFPHLSVLDNVGYGLRGAAWEQRRATALKHLAAVRLADRAGAFPHMLSGGEQQRVALVRALAPGPAALLLDEPFSGLDAHLKSEVRSDLLTTLHSANAAVLVVTHDAAEAMLMADELVLMVGGRIVQTGPPQDCYRRPASPQAARLLGEVSLLPGQVSGGVVATVFGDLPAPGLPDGPAQGAIRPEAAILGGSGVQARVVGHGFGGAFHELELERAGQRLRLRVAMAPPPLGATVEVRLDPDQASVFPADSDHAVRDRS
ncbi:ABC transporter ATP-binding protein [Phenylobacterium sp.]|uniref:ABC transporter ATP-binding protein n=1 Tax=Phenylobacterium sp. TaxID=1871053 RepID=UPI0037C84EAC